MDIATTKLELMQQLMSIVDEQTLRKVASFFKKEVVTEQDEGYVSDEEYAQFQEELAQRDRGEIKFHTREESMAEIRRLIDGAGG